MSLYQATAPAQSLTRMLTMSSFLSLVPPFRQHTGVQLRTPQQLAGATRKGVRAETEENTHGAGGGAARSAFMYASATRAVSAALTWISPAAAARCRSKTAQALASFGMVA